MSPLRASALTQVGGGLAVLGACAALPPRVPEDGPASETRSRSAARAESKPDAATEADAQAGPVAEADAVARAVDESSGEDRSKTSVATLPSHSVTVEVPDDRPVEVFFGERDQPWAFVYMHGLCGDPFAFQSWARAVRPLGTLISLRGDLPCKGRPGRSKWSFDYAGTDRRITATIDAVDAARRAEAGEAKLAPLQRDRVFLIGYSQGAHRAQWMVARFPKRYPRVALIALSTEPVVPRLAAADRVLLMAGGRDARRHIYEGHLAMEKAGHESRYVELPGARHGEYGPQATETMAEALAWLADGAEAGGDAASTR